MDVFGFCWAEFSLTQVIIALVAFLLSYQWYKRPSGFPPGPRGIPFLGVLHRMGRFPERRFREWSEKYGPIFSVRMGRNDWVVLNDYETIIGGLVKQKEKFSGRPRFPLFEKITDSHGLVFSDYNSSWKSQRRFGITTLRGFGVGKKSMEERVIEEVDYLCQQFQKQNGKPFNILNQLTNAVSNNICSVAFGKRYDYSDEEFAKVVKHLGFGFNDLTQSRMIRLMIFEPDLMKIPLFYSAVNRFVSDLNTVQEVLKKIVAHHKATFDQNNLRDFIDAFIENMGEKGDGHFTDKQLLHFVRELFVAGTETSTSTLRWAILVLLHYPETQTKIFEEITRVIGLYRNGTMADKQNMPYTSAFIEELYRFRTLVPLNLLHKTNEDSTINGYFIPKNTRIATNLWAVHNNPKVFDEPDKFNPGRHLDEMGHFVKSKHVIPFSVGPRHCLGEQLARMEIFIFIVSLVQKFKFQPDPNCDCLPEIIDGVSGNLFLPLPYLVVAKER